MSGHQLYHSLLGWNEQAIGLFAEVDEYNRFWCRFLTVVLLNFVMLISQFIYIIFISTAKTFFKFVYVWVLALHIFLLALLIYNCGSVFESKFKLTKLFFARLTQLGKRKVGMKFREHFKLHDLICELDSKERGFGLVTEYVIRYDTFRLVCFDGHLIGFPRLF